MLAHFVHHAGTLVRQGSLKATQTVNAAQRRIEACTQTSFGQRNVTGNSLTELARVGDLVDEERIDLVELAARNLNTDIVQFEAQETIFDHLYVVCLQKSRNGSLK